VIRYVVPIRNFFAANFHLKLTSVLLALLLWVTINGEPKSEIRFRVPLEYRNLPKGVEVLDDTVNTIDVRLTASSGMIKRLAASDITAAIDLSNWSFGERTYSISAANIRLPYGVGVTKITPSKVRLRFEPTGHKIVPIRPRTIGKAADGHAVSAITCRPPSVEIEGPEGHLAAVHFVSTDSIDVSGRSESFAKQVDLFVEDPLLRLSEIQQSDVEIRITSTPAAVE
jgi:YbbR domain-containing protein